MWLIQSLIATKLSSFLGKVGSWKADFTVEQNEVADEWMKNESVGLDDIKLTFEL